MSKKVRKYIYDQFYQFGVPPTLEKLIGEFKEKREDILLVLHGLHENHLLVIDKKINKIMIANPFAGIATSFVVKTKTEKKYFATCAWDSIAMHITLEEDIDIHAFCLYCNNGINLSLKDEKIVSKTPSDTLIHFQYPASKWWDDIIDTCYNTMNFFCSRGHLQEWVKLNPSRSGYYLNDSQIIDISILLYKNKMDLEYKRPSTDQLRERFNKNGLTGEFWKI